MYIFFLIFFSITVYHRVLNIVLSTIHRTLMFIHPIYTRLLIPNSPSIPFPIPSPLADFTFKTSVTLSLTMWQIKWDHFNQVPIWYVTMWHVHTLRDNHRGYTCSTCPAPSQIGPPHHLAWGPPGKPHSPYPSSRFHIPSCGAMGITRILSPFSQEAQRSWLGWGCTLLLPGHHHGSRLASTEYSTGHPWPKTDNSPLVLVHPKLQRMHPEYSYEFSRHPLL